MVRRLKVNHNTKDGYDGFVTFAYHDDNWGVSLRSEIIDVSVIAKSYGGGGHRGAAGFQVENIDQFLNKHKL